jgi:GT2 family glycosyltransferase
MAERGQADGGVIAGVNLMPDAKRKLTLCIPTLRRYDTLWGLVESACGSSHVPDRIVVLDNGGGLPADAFFSAAPAVTVVKPGRNVGVATSWNYFLGACDDYLVISNDDVVLHRHCLRILVDAAEAAPHELFFHPEPRDGHTYSLFLQRKRSLELIGGYDENFWPAYFEDNDYSYRLRLAGYSTRHIAGATYDHVGGATMQSLSDDEARCHTDHFERNQRYYVCKWGGPPGEERYTLPFGDLPSQGSSADAANQKGEEDVRVS